MTLLELQKLVKDINIILDDVSDTLIDTKHKINDIRQTLDEQEMKEAEDWIK